MSGRIAFTDEAILRAIRSAAQQCGQPLSHTRYASVSHDVGGPSVARIIQRFGSWRAACNAAGVQCCVPSRDYQQRWDRRTVTAAVADYLSDAESSGTYTDYQRWARADPERPSGATVRNVLGGWAAAKQAAG